MMNMFYCRISIQNRLIVYPNTAKVGQPNILQALLTKLKKAVYSLRQEQLPLLTGQVNDALQGANNSVANQW